MAGWDPEEYLAEVHPEVRVYEWPLPTPLLGCCDHRQRVIWLAMDLDPVRRRCTLAEEVGHLEQGPLPPDPYAAQARQRAAQEWAARMLLPLEVFVDGFGTSFDLAVVAGHMGVDLATLRTRIRCATDEEQDLAMWALQELRAAA